jgi:hypothetical protein
MGLVVSVVAISMTNSIQRFRPSLLFYQQGGDFTTGSTVGTMYKQAMTAVSGLNVTTTTSNVTQWRDSCTTRINMSIALACLQKATPNLQTFSYPIDAEAHMTEIHQAMDQWVRLSTPHCAINYCGPWIEHHWVNHFSRSSNTSSSSSSKIKNTVCLSDTFGAFIPLLIPWVSIWSSNGNQYPDGFVEKLLSLIRPNVAYITVSQNDEGLPGNNEMPILSNVLVLSAGGFGHVPIPLLKRDIPLLNETTRIPISNRTWLISYVGSLGNAPRRMRRRMNKALQRHGQPYLQHHSSGVENENKWHQIMADSMFSMAPRGYGRTSYHLMEVMQSGLIPIHIYQENGVPWIPYLTLYQEQELGYASTVRGLPNLLNTLRNMTASDIEAQEARVASYRESHFVPAGIMHQISLFMMGEGSDLECVALPSSLRE